MPYDFLTAHCLLPTSRISLRLLDADVERDPLDLGHRRGELDHLAVRDGPSAWRTTLRCLTPSATASACRS